MIQYLVILLDESSVSYCHYENSKRERRLMPIETLKNGILYGMKENLNIQFVYPEYDLPQEYNDLIETIDHTKIKPYSHQKGADVVVVEGFGEVKGESGKTYVVRTTISDLIANTEKVCKMCEKIERLNIVLTDIEKFQDGDGSSNKNSTSDGKGSSSKNSEKNRKAEGDREPYSKCLATIAKKIEQLYVDEKTPQLNILTDRMMLDKMNNCGAGDNNITLAPNGEFYVCPAFYLSDDGYSIGNLQRGLDIKNPQLYKLEYAPLCSQCDAYHCRRCVWLNRKTTLEVNTPSHEQCVVAHLERNASRQLLIDIRKHGEFLPDKEEIKEIDYLDPFDVKKEW